MCDNPNSMSVEQIYSAQQEIISFMKENQLDLAEDKLRALATSLREEYRTNPCDFVGTSIAWVGATNRDLTELKEKQCDLHIQRTNAAIAARHKAENIEKHLHLPKHFSFPFTAVVLLGISFSLVLVQLYCAYFTPCFMTAPSWLSAVMENPVVDVVVQKVIVFVQTHPDIFTHTITCEALNTHATVYAFIGVSLTLAMMMIVVEVILLAARKTIYRIGKHRYNHWLKKANTL